jgi:hypothetical protein
LLGGLQHRFPAAAGDHHHIAHVGRAHVGAQAFVQGYISLRDRTERRDLVVEQAGPIAGKNGAGRQQHGRRRPAQGRGSLRQRLQHTPNGRDVVNAKPGRQQMRQHVAGYRGGYDQAGDRIQAELRQAWKTGQQQ